jgi:hypothetical protein
MRTRLGALVLALLLALGSAACGSKDEPDSKPAPSSAPSPTAPPGFDVTEPKPPKDPADTRESAEEFARYFVEVEQYATRIRDVAPIAGLARDQAACSSCRQASAYIQGLKKDQLWETGDDIEVGDLTVRSTGASAYTVAGPAVYPRIGFVDITGDGKAQQATSNYRFSVDLVFDADRDRWQIDDYTLSIKGRT